MFRYLTELTPVNNRIQNAADAIPSYPFSPQNIYFCTFQIATRLTNSDHLVFEWILQFELGHYIAAKERYFMIFMRWISGFDSLHLWTDSINAHLTNLIYFYISPLIISIMVSIEYIHWRWHQHCFFSEINEMKSP